MTFLKLASLALFVATALTSCASADLDRKLDERLARSPDIRTRKDLDAKVTALLDKTPGLSPKQRSALNDLRASTQTKLRDLNQESLKLRGLLVDDLLARDSRAPEIETLKARLRKLSKERVDVLFGAVNGANEILGRNALVREAMDLQLMEDETPF
jgi:hypothetical protein